MFKEKEILEELKFVNALLQIIAMKMDSLIILSKTKRVKETQKKGDDK